VTAGILVTTVPTISGTVKVGDEVTAVPGVWQAGSTVLPASDLTYQWLRNGTNIPGATNSTYMLGTADKGTRLSVRIAGEYAGYATASKTSTTQPVAAGTLASTVPTISGTAKVASTLTAQPGVWQAGTVTLTAFDFTYQWYANGKKIAGATAATYTVASSCLGKNITVIVTGSYTGYATASRTSAATAPVTK
jgi:hypothetical protein